MSTITRTFCISDVVDSTALASRTGGPGADRLRRRYIASLRAAVDRDGGEVVKHLGDGLMVAFDSAGAAMRAARAMQAGVSRLEAYAGGPALRLRVGIALGEVTVEQGDYFGRPVVVASRLCALATAGEILAENLVAQVAGDHGVETEPVGPRLLKGLPGAVDVVRIPWSGDVGDVSLLPATLARVASGPFVGRRHELAVVTERWSGAESGRGSTVLFRGPAGSGKTSLAAQAARLALADGGIVAFAAAEPGLGSAQRLANEVLKGLAASGSAGSRLRPGDGVDRETLFEDVSDAVAGAAVHTPVLLVFDDLQWAGTDGLLLVCHLARSLAEHGAVVLGLDRGDRPPRDDVAHAATVDLLRLPHVRTVDLGGLTEDDIRTLLADAGLDPGAASAVMVATGGLPFSVAEVLRALRSGGSAVRLVESPDGLRLDGVPTTLQDMLELHVSRLSDETVRALIVGAVLGREFDAEVVSAVIDAPLRPTLAGAVNGGLVRETGPGRYGFEHDLVRQSLLADLPPGELADLHRRVADVLAEQGAGAGRCCWHKLHGADRATAADAIDATLEAVGSARRRLGHHQLATHLQLAREVLGRFLPSDDGRRSRVLLAIADLEAWRNDAKAVKGHSVEAAEAAVAAGDTLAAAEAAILYGGWVDAGSVDPIADRLFSAVTVEETADHDVSVAARLAAAAADYQSINVGQPAEGLALAELAVQLSSEADDDGARADALWAVANALLGSADADRRLAIAAQLSEVGARFGPARVSANRLAVHTHLAVGDLVGWAQAAGDLARIADRYGSGEARMWSSVVRCEELLRTGILDEASTAIDQFLDDWGHYPTGQSIYAAQRFQLERELGHLDVVVPALEEVAESETRLGAFRVAHLLALVETGRHEEVLRRIDELPVDAELSTFRRDQTWVGTLCGLAEVAEKVRATELASVVAPLLDPFGGQVAVVAQGVVSVGAVDRYLGLLAAMRGDADEASEAYARAALLEARVAAPTQRIRTLRAWAALERQRDQGRADDIVAELRATAATTAAGP